VITLNWVPLASADILSYKVYRSMIGFKADLALPVDLEGLTLVLAMQQGPVQTITFTGGLSVVEQINAQLVGGKAYAAADVLATYFFVRSDIRSAPGMIELLGGTANVLLNLIPRTITERSEDILLATVMPLVDETATVSYVDLDGVSQDYYAIATVNHLTDESMKSAFRQPITATGSLCVLSGIIENLAGARLADAEVTATLLGTPQNIAGAGQISKKPIRTLSGPDGRYSLAVLQCTIVRIDIPLIGYSREIAVPAQMFADIADLGSDDSANLQIDRTPEGTW